MLSSGELDDDVKLFDVLSLRISLSKIISCDWLILNWDVVNIIHVSCLINYDNKLMSD